jgi:hypothetical protein
MAAAIGRLNAAWADKDEPAIAALRQDHAEELCAANASTKLQLGIRCARKR